MVLLDLKGVKIIRGIIFENELGEQVLVDYEFLDDGNLKIILKKDSGICI